MKLYSKGQMVFRCGLCIIAGAICGFCSLYFSKSLAKKSNDYANAIDTIDDSTKMSVSGVQGGSTNANAKTVASIPGGYTQDEMQNITVYEKCNEAVVNITTQVMGMNWFFEPVVQEGGSGSGSIIDKRGYVVTNCHVIEKTSKIYISLFDGSQYEGRIIGQDTASDIAVLKFDPPKDKNLTTIDFGNSNSLKVGQKVIAIGNPFAFERTMTTGIVSGLGRPIQETNSTIIRNMIQTDTAINPGNSGGPLLDTQGRMIGINTMIFSTSGSSAGIGFAVPVETAVRVVKDLIQFGKVQRGSIKASLIPFNSSFARQAQLPVNSGILVSKVEKGSAADKSGLKGGTKEVTYNTGWERYSIFLGGDIIMQIDNIVIDSLAAFNSALESHRPEDKVKAKINRAGKEIILDLVLD